MGADDDFVSTPAGERREDASRGEEWFHEIDYGGLRIGCFLQRGSVRLLGADGRDRTEDFPEIVEDFSKLDLARFSERIAEWILPHLVGRSPTLVRCTKGLAGECVYMRRAASARSSSTP